MWKASDQHCQQAVKERLPEIASNSVPVDPLVLVPVTEEEEEEPAGAEIHLVSGEDLAATQTAVQRNSTVRSRAIRLLVYQCKWATGKAGLHGKSR